MMSRYKVLYLIITLVISGIEFSYAQGVLNQGGNILISQGAYLYITGANSHFVSSSNGKTDNDGVISLQGHWVNNAGNNIFKNPDNSGFVIFNGTTVQHLKGSAETCFEKVLVDNSAGIKMLSNQTIAYELGFNNGKIDASDKILTIGTLTSNGKITGAGDSKYVIALDPFVNDSSFGRLRVRVNSKNDITYNFPVGDSNNYSPFSIKVNNITGSIANAYLDLYVTKYQIPHLNNSLPEIIKRHWSISPSGFTSPNVDFEYNYIQQDFEGTYEDSLLPVKFDVINYEYVWTSSAGNNFTDALTEGTGSVNVLNNKITWAGVHSFSKVGAAGNRESGSPQPLPVSLLYFLAQCNNKEKYVEINWCTASEINNDYFIIEKSTDAVNWYNTYKVYAAGNSNTMNYYNFADKEPGFNYLQEATLYYRLKQTDYDGTSTYSDICSVKSCKVNDNTNNDLIVFPNPVDEVLYINFYAEKISKISVEIYGNDGKMHGCEYFNAKEGANIYNLSMKKFPSGYYLVALNNNTERHYLKVIKK